MFSRGTQPPPVPPAAADDPARALLHLDETDIAHGCSTTAAGSLKSWQPKWSVPQDHASAPWRLSDHLSALPAAALRRPEVLNRARGPGGHKEQLSDFEKQSTIPPEHFKEVEEKHAEADVLRKAQYTVETTPARPRCPTCGLAHPNRDLIDIYRSCTQCQMVLREPVELVVPPVRKKSRGSPLRILIAA